MSAPDRNGRASALPPAPFPSAPLSLLDLHAPGFSGVEANACLIEIRLALHFWRQHHGPDAWRVYNVAVGRA